MTIDVRELMTRAAAKPASELDVAALVSTARRRRRVRAACAGAAVVAVAAVAVVVSLPGADRGGIQTPARPVPTTVPTRIPDVSKTHASR